MSVFQSTTLVGRLKIANLSHQCTAIVRPETLLLRFLTVAGYLSVVVHRRRSAFPVAAARIGYTWNSLPQHVTSVPSMSVFRYRLKAFFRRSLPSYDSHYNICSACLVTVLIFGHLNHCLLYTSPSPRD